LRKNHRYEADVLQDLDQFSQIDQESDEFIFIKNSYNCCVESTDTQAAVSLQVGLQLAIALVLRITLFDSNESGAVSEELFQAFTSQQSNTQKVIIENSKDVKVTTTDTDLSVNIQALLQVLLTLVATLDVL
jgi:spore coat protein X